MQVEQVDPVARPDNGGAKAPRGLKPSLPVTITILYESMEASDTARRSGMEHGMAAGYSRLEELLASQQKEGKQ